MHPLAQIDKPTFDQLKQELGAEFMFEIVTAYCHDSKQLIAAVHQALAEQDAPTFTRHAHSLKSTSLTLGALKFGDFARQLEQLGKQGNLIETAPTLQSLTTAHPDLENNLKDLLHD